MYYSTAVAGLCTRTLVRRRCMVVIQCTSTSGNTVHQHQEEAEQVALVTRDRQPTLQLCTAVNLCNAAANLCTAVNLCTAAVVNLLVNC